MNRFFLTLDTPMRDTDSPTCQRNSFFVSSEQMSEKVKSFYTMQLIIHISGHSEILKPSLVGVPQFTPRLRLLPYMEKKFILKRDPTFKDKPFQINASKFDKHHFCLLRSGRGNAANGPRRPETSPRPSYLCTGPGRGHTRHCDTLRTFHFQSSSQYAVD